MSREISLRVDTSAVEAGLKVLGNEAPLAIRRAMDRTVLNVRTVMVRKVAAEMQLPQKHVRERVEVVRTGGGKAAHIYASTKQTPLILFGARGPEPSRGKGRGVRARTKQQVYPNAFIATMDSSHRGAFVYIGKPTRKRRSPRAWSDNLRIRELREASVWSVWIHYADLGQRRGEEMLPKNLQHEVGHLLKTKVQAAFNRTSGVRRVAT